MNPERLDELLALQATDGLSPAEADELRRLLEQSPAVERDGFDRAAAAVALTQPVAPPPPPGLLAKLESDAGRFFQKPAPRRVEEQHGWLLWSGWLTAAACLLLALWWARPFAERDLPLAQLAAASGTQRLPAADPKTQQPAGEVVWNPRRQSGYLVLDGLPVNNPRREQYQLWIFDKDRDDRYPVDGGVFDVEAGRATVPIRAKLPVGEPTLFAVTVERPGGVVVSDRSRIVWVATAK